MEELEAWIAWADPFNDAIELIAAVLRPGAGVLDCHQRVPLQIAVRLSLEDLHQPELSTVDVLRGLV
jgi:hypothetical protein